LTARALNTSYQATKGAQVQIVIEDISRGLDQPKEVHRAQGESSDQGEVSMTWQPTQSGAYRVRALSSLDGVDRESSDLFIVADSLVELRDITPRPDLLKAISDLSDGDTLEVGDDWSSLKRRKPAITQVNRRDDIALWATWWALVIALLIPTIEWTLRRRWGLS
jgi:hypothetical protein